jgi:hypothetical protein
MPTAQPNPRAVSPSKRRAEALSCTKRTLAAIARSISAKKQFPAWIVAFGIRRVRGRASIDARCLSNSRPERDATRPSPVLRRAQVSATPASGNCRFARHPTKCRFCCVPASPFQQRPDRPRRRRSGLWLSLLRPAKSARIMRYELADYEWTAIRPANKTRAFLSKRPTCPQWGFSGSCDPGRSDRAFGTYTCYNPFVG